MMTNSDQVNERSLTDAGSPERFGYEWNHYNEILPESQVQLQRWLGSFRLEQFAQKSVMDVGCGMGRNPFWILKAKAKSLTAVDVDDRSLEAARRNLAAFPNAKVQKCSVYELSPAQLGQFDCVTHIGVLHHLADPNLALAKMWGCVRPGGQLIVWVYGKTGNRLILPFIQAARWFGSRLPLPIVHVLAHILGAIVWAGVRLVPIKIEYYQFIRKLSFKNLVSIVFDQMIPRIANYWDEPEIESMISRLPQVKSKIIEQVQGNSWTFILKKHES